MTQSILKRVQAILKSVGLSNCTIKQEYSDKIEVGNNNWKYAYQVNIPLCEFFDKYDNFNKWAIQDKLYKAEILCKERIKDNVANVHFIQTFMSMQDSMIKQCNGSFAYVEILYKHKPVERVGIPEQMQLFKVEDYACK